VQYFDLPLESPVKPYLLQIHQVIDETGAAHAKAGHKDLAFAILDIAAHSKDGEGRPSASKFVEAIVRLIPAFQDMGVVQTKNGPTNIYVFKKAQLLASDLHELFAKDNADFRWVDLTHLAIFADNVVPTMLDHYKLIELGQVLTTKTNSATDNLEWSEALTLRAATVDIADQIVKAAKDYPHAALKNMDAVQLGYYLWKLGKDKEFIGLPRSSCRTTIFY